MNTQKKEVNVTNIVDNLYKTYKELGNNNAEDLGQFLLIITIAVFDKFTEEQYTNLNTN